MLLPLRRKIDDRTAAIGVIGLGYVGLPLLHAFHAGGYPVIGFDTDPEKIRMLSNGENYLKHLGADMVAGMLAAGRFECTSDMSRLSEPDVVIVCVPTPLDVHLEPDMTYIERSAEGIAAVLRPGQLVVLESSTYPGTTREIMQPRFERRGLKCGRDYFLAFSPEREDPGSKNFNTRTIPKLVGGIDAKSGDLACQLYAKVISEVVPVSSAEVAEAAKLLENIYRAVNIALVNELKVVLTAMGIDVWEVIDAAATKPFGFQPFYPGPGLGGHCIPIDPFYLTWKAREFGQATKFVELAGQINRAMPDWVVSRVALALNEDGKAVRGSRLLVLGLAYKPDVDDVRESPSFELVEKLEELGAHVDYNDPHVPKTRKTRRHDLQMQSVPLTPESLAAYDAVIIGTNHRAYDWNMIAAHARLIVDTRGATRRVTTPKARIVSA
jgi:UDP-N-acetyl-D-glucosamine dehydrogenase